MADNAQKQPLARNLNIFADQRIQDWLQLQQQPLPCHVTAVMGSLVEVAFDVDWSPFTLPRVVMAKAQSAWSLEPTQVGDKGTAQISNLYLGGQTGIGTGTADQYRHGNLVNLIFQPVTNKSMAMADPDTHYIIGPKGANMQTQDGSVSVAVTPTGITMTFPGGTVQMESGNIFISPESGGMVNLGGDGTTGTYEFVETTSGASINVRARTA